MRDYPYFRSGNVVLDPYGSIVIITDERVSENHENGKIKDRYYSCIFFDYANSRGGFWESDFKRNRPCFCCEGTENGDYDEECEDCKGTGSYKVNIKGASHAKLLGETVKDYITKRLTKNFEWK